MTIAWCCGFAVKYVAGTDVLVRLSIEERKAKISTQSIHTIRPFGCSRCAQIESTAHRARVESRRYENFTPLCRCRFSCFAGLLFCRSVHHRAGFERAVSIRPNECGACTTCRLDFRQQRGAQHLGRGCTRFRAAAADTL